MKAKRMATNITRLRGMLKKHKLVADETLWIMNEAASQVGSCPPKEWEILITPDRPVEFVRTETDDRLRPDVFCNIKATTNGTLPLSHLRLVLRVWSVTKDMSFRPDWDSNRIRQEFRRIGAFSRVMFRCHYDNCSPQQYAPIFHMHFGGDPTNGEHCWFPHFLELPRFPSPPIDLILACELVVATFFPSVHRKLMQNGAWISLIQESESFFLGEFYKTCKNYFDSKPSFSTLLDHLSSFMT